MQFRELKAQVKSVEFDELRSERDNYFEAVITKDKLKNLTPKLKDFFGASIWPSKKKLPPQVEEAIKDFGGIIAGQTLYFNNHNQNVAFAMLWPWQDGKHTTVKIIQK